jgi:biotin carboxyl carrier protein
VSDLEARINDEIIDSSDGWHVEWVDRDAGIVRVSDGTTAQLALAEGDGTDWTVTIRGRRIVVAVRTWRERMLAEAQDAAAAHGGPLEVKASLPGLVVAIAVEAGASVAAGDPLLTIEAMKMQNEVRAPRDGTIGQVAVSAGSVVATGQLLLRLD